MFLEYRITLNACFWMIKKCHTRYCSVCYRSSCPEVFCKKVVLRNFAKFTENICVRVSFLLKLQARPATLFKKKTLAQVFSCEFCEISNNTFFYRTPLVTASVVRQNTKHKKDENTRIERKEIWKKREIKWNVCFWNTCRCYAWLLRFLWKVFKNNIRTFVWQLFAYFYQISNKCYCLMFLIDLFSWTIISSGSQKYKGRTNLQVP